MKRIKNFISNYDAWFLRNQPLLWISKIHLVIPLSLLTFIVLFFLGIINWIFCVTNDLATTTCLSLSLVCSLLYIFWQYRVMQKQHRLNQALKFNISSAICHFLIIISLNSFILGGYFYTLFILNKSQFSTDLDIYTYSTVKIINEITTPYKFNNVEGSDGELNNSLTDYEILYSTFYISNWYDCDSYVVKTYRKSNTNTIQFCNILDSAMKNRYGKIDFSNELNNICRKYSLIPTDSIKNLFSEHYRFYDLSNNRSYDDSEIFEKVYPHEITLISRILEFITFNRLFFNGIIFTFFLLLTINLILLTSSNILEAILSPIIALVIYLLVMFLIKILSNYFSEDYMIEFLCILYIILTVYRTRMTFSQKITIKPYSFVKLFKIHLTHFLLIFVTPIIFIFISLIFKSYTREYFQGIVLILSLAVLPVIHYVFIKRYNYLYGLPR